MMYTIIDNTGNLHSVSFNSYVDALETLKTTFKNYIFSILISDPVVVFRPNGYLLSYINTADGSQVVKTMSDWLCS